MAGSVLVTGATGFVGGHLCAALRRAGRPVLATVRPGRQAPPGTIPVPVADLAGGLPDAAVLGGVDAMVHLAARVHQMRGTPDATAFQRDNTEATARLAAQAAAAGLRRLVLVSTVKVLGEASGTAPFRDDSPPGPADAYAATKLAAEEAALAVAARSGLEAVVLRPPLVYGPGAKGNVPALLRLARSGLPLPLAAIDNRRSLLFVDNLVDALILALDHPGAAGGRFLLRDGEDLSTPALVARLRLAMGLAPRLFRLPPALLRQCGRLLRREAAVARLLDSLAVRDDAIRRLGWRPPVTVGGGLALTVFAEP